MCDAPHTSPEHGRGLGSRAPGIDGETLRQGDARALEAIENRERLVRRLSEAPADLHIETLVGGQGAGPRGTLERLRPEPADILPKDRAQITGFRLSSFKGGAAAAAAPRPASSAVSTRRWTASTPRSSLMWRRRRPDGGPVPNRSAPVLGPGPFQWYGHDQKTGLASVLV